MKSRRKYAAVVTMVVAALAATTIVVHRQSQSLLLTAYWWSGVLVLTFCLGSFVKGKTYGHLPVAKGRIVAVIPAYEEEGWKLNRTIQSLLNQTVTIDEIHVIDDGSKVHPVVPWDHPRVFFHRQENTGKRGAQVTVLRKLWNAFNLFDFVLTIDSDGEPMPDAVEQLLRAMSDPKVEAATGMIYVRNYDESWVARAADIDIGTSCVLMRASRSMLGALETTSGALAVYRSGLLYDHLDAYAVECGTGDDRWLALRALERGQVVGVNEAGVITDMPPTLKGMYRQRLRWARSWWWMLPRVLTHLSNKQLISPVLGMAQLLITPIILGWMVYATLAGGWGRYSNPWVVWVYAATYVIVRFGLSAMYLMHRPDLSVKEKVKSWLWGTPAAILVNVFLLTPTRYWALAKLKDNRWQSRGLTGKVPGGKTELAMKVWRLDPDDPDGTETTAEMPSIRSMEEEPDTVALTVIRFNPGETM